MRLHSLLLLALTLSASGCDRALLDEVPPDLAIVAPDLGEVQLSPAITVRVSAEAIRGVQRVLVDGADATFVAGDEVWEASVILSPGVTEIPLEAFASTGETTRDTAYAVFSPLTVTSPPVQILPEPRAGLTATRVPGRGVLLAGGETGSTVLDDARILTEAGLAFSVGDAIPLQRARTGHTASTLLDGRVLLLGGTSTPSATPTSFVSEAEIFDPATLTTRRVVTDGTPIRRTHHVTAFLDLEGRQYVYVWGGQIPSGGSVVTPETVEIAELRPGADADTLVILSPSTQASGGASLPDPTQIIVGSRPSEVATVVSGLAGSSSDTRRVRYATPGTLTFPFQILTSEAPAPAVPRTAADGALLSGSLALLIGGQSPSGETLASIEAYADAAGRWVRFPASVRLGTARRNHAVTLAPSGRILAIGGRGPAGQPLATLDVLSF